MTRSVSQTSAIALGVAILEDAERLRIQGRAALEAKLDQVFACGADAEQARRALAGTIVDFFDTALAEVTAEVRKRWQQRCTHTSAAPTN